MSKHWRYEVWIPASQILTAAQMRHVLELAGEHGYVPRAISRVLPTYDMEEHKVGSIDAAVDILYPDGGLLALGRATAEEWDTAIQIDIPSATQSKPENPTGPAATAHAHNRLYDELVLYVGDYMYGTEAESPERVEHATDVRQLYCDLCTYFDAPYGAAWSNYDYEEISMDLHLALYGHLELSFDETPDNHTFQALMDGERLDAEVQNGQPPGVLFWLQYFSREYAERIDLESCARLGGKLQPLPKGVLLSFFHYPWRVNFLRLLAINKHWRKLNPDSLRL